MILMTPILTDKAELALEVIRGADKFVGGWSADRLIMHTSTGELWLGLGFSSGRCDYPPIGGILLAH